MEAKSFFKKTHAIQWYAACVCDSGPGAGINQQRLTSGALYAYRTMSSFSTYHRRCHRRNGPCCKRRAWRGIVKGSKTQANLVQSTLSTGRRERGADLLLQKARHEVVAGGLCLVVQPAARLQVEDGANAVNGGS